MMDPHTAWRQTLPRRAGTERESLNLAARDIRNPGIHTYSTRRSLGLTYRQRSTKDQTAFERAISGDSAREV